MNNVCNVSIAYPKDCYDNQIKDKIKVTKSQYELLITEIRAWENNVHLELNIGSHFEIINNQ
mgnify:CR=1 FL=1